MHKVYVVFKFWLGKSREFFLKKRENPVNYDVEILIMMHKAHAFKTT